MVVGVKNRLSRRCFRCVLLLVALLWQCGNGTSAFAEVALEDFDRSLQAHVLAPNGSVTNKAENVGFIFVPGLGAHFDVSYFRGAKNEIFEQLGKETPVYHIWPKMNRSNPDQSAIRIENAFANAFREYPDKKWRVVAHSMGSIDLWAFFAKHPEALDRVELTLLLQAPFEGSELSSFLLGKGKVSEVFKPFKETKDYVTASIMRRLYYPSTGPVTMLHPQKMKEYIAGLQEARGTDIAKYRENMIFMGTHENMEDTPIINFAAPSQGILGVCGRALTRISGRPNDGLVTIDSQLPAMSRGRQLVYPDRNHGTFTNLGGGGRALGKALSEKY